jgi:hypothetical protein
LGGKSWKGAGKEGNQTENQTCRKGFCGVKTAFWVVEMLLKGLVLENSSTDALMFGNDSFKHSN